MSHSKVTVMLDGADAIELGEALIDAGIDTQSTGDVYAVEFIQSKAVALPYTDRGRIEIERSEVTFEVKP